MSSNPDNGPVSTLSFIREVTAPLATLWQAWTDPAARALWAARSPGEVHWLELQPLRRSVNSEVLSREDMAQSSALVTAEFSGGTERSKISVTVQLPSGAENMEAAYREAFAAAMDDLAAVAERTLVIERVIKAPRPVVWSVWMNPETLPQWWGPDGFSCRTKRIDLRSGGEWVFDMIAPDGTVFPNHHRYNTVQPEDRIAYTLLWGENGPKHADAWVTLTEEGNATRITLGMVMRTQAEHQQAMGFGAIELGQQTLGKLERFALKH